jgi:Right handed beta helix region
MRSLALVGPSLAVLLPSVLSTSVTPDALWLDRGITHFATAKDPTRILHVDAAAKAGGTGSAARPFQRIRDAVAKATPGTAVRIHPGTYPGGTWIQKISGTAKAPIWIGGVKDKAKPLISGGNTGLHLSQVRYLVLHDLEVQKSRSNGINCDDGGRYANQAATQFVVFERLHIHDIGGTGNQDGLKLSGLDDYWVLDSRFQRCGGRSSGSGVDHVGCHRGLLAGNRFEDMSGNAIQCKGGSEDIEIRANHFIRAGARAINLGGSTGFQYFRPPLSKTKVNFEAKNIRVFSNLFTGADTAVAFAGSVDCIVAQNTIVDPKVWIFRILQETRSSQGYTFVASSKGRFLNNIVWFSRKTLRRDVNVGSGTLPLTFQIANNLWYAHDQPTASKPRLPVTETRGIYGKHPGINPPKSHFITNSSPAAGKGLRFKPVPDRDLGWRGFRKTPGIGAYEIR